MLINVLIISGAVHVLALLILGGITVVKYIIPDDAEFDEPPAIEEVEPPKEVKVDIKPPAPTPQRQMNNLQMRPMANIAISNVDVALPSMDQSFTVSTGVGSLGGNLMGSTRGSIGIGMSSVNVFGLESRGEKILFVIDASRNMVYDEKGGLDSYKVIKDEITNLVGNLAAGTLYNVMLYENTAYKLFKPQLVSAGASSTAELAQWFAPFNSSINTVGIGRGAQRIQIQTELEDYPRMHAGLLRWPNTAALTQLTLEMKVDAIFYITGQHPGYGRVRKDLTKEEQVEYEIRAKEEAERIKNDPESQAMIAARQAERDQMQKTIEAKVKALNAQRAANGLPPKVITTHLEANMNMFGLKYSTPTPPRVPNYPIIWAEEREIKRYFKTLDEKLFLDRGDRPPNINVILFLAEDEELRKEAEDSLKGFVRDYKGKMKIIRGLAEINGAKRGG